MSQPAPEPGAANTGAFTGVASGAVATGFVAVVVLSTVAGLAYVVNKRNK